MVRSWIYLAFVLVFVAGCRFWQISDEEIDAIAKATAGTVQSVTATVAAPALPSGAGAGIGAIAGLVVAALTRWGLKAVQKKP